MDRDTLLAFVRFHAWANDRILTTAAGLSDAEFRRAANLDHGSAFTTLRHLVDVDWSWRELCIGNDVGETYVWDHGFVLDDLPALHAFCLQEDVRLRTYVESLDEAALAESLAMSADFAATRWLVLAHVVNHGTQHRSELLATSPSAGTHRGISSSWTRSNCDGRERLMEVRERRRLPTQALADGESDARRHVSIIGDRHDRVRGLGLRGALRIAQGRSARRTRDAQTACRLAGVAALDNLWLLLGPLPAFERWQARVPTT